MISLYSPFSRRVVLVVGIVCLTTSFASIIFVAARNDKNQPRSDNAVQTPDASSRARIAQRFGQLPLSFEINQGQSDRSVKFLARGPGYELFLTATDAVLTLRKKSDPEVREGSVLRLRMIGANATPQVSGQDELPGKVNYFIGNEPEKWRRNVPTYRKVYYTGVYPGIDMVYYGNQRELEYDFVVAAGANPKVIRFRVEGADRIRLDETGNLLLALKHGEVQLHKPSIYQLTDDGTRREIKGQYVVNGNEVRFKVQSFDSGTPLVIDPVLSYSTFLGAGSNERGLGIAVDSQGSAYVTGPTESRNFPTTPGAFKTSSNFAGAFVSKLNPAGTDLVYSTYLAGSVSGSVSATATSIAVDAAGNAHVTGFTRAFDFPIVNGLKSGSNFWKNADGVNWNNLNTGIVGDVHTIAVAPNAPNVIYAGATSGIHRSNDSGATWAKLPTQSVTSNPFATALAVDPTNSSVLYVALSNSGLIKTTDGGNNWSVLPNLPAHFPTAGFVAIDPATPSTIYVGSPNAASKLIKTTNSGSTWTELTNFGVQFPFFRAIAIDPTTPSTIYVATGGNGVLKSTNGGDSWTPMNNGMENQTNINAIVIDASNPSTLYTSHLGDGVKKSTDGAASWSPVNNGLQTFAITNLAITSSAVYAATFGNGVVKSTNGGTNWTSVNTGLGSVEIRAFAAHPTGSTVYAGTLSSFFQDAFVTKLNSSGSGLLFSTLLGGNHDDFANALAVDGAGNISVVGHTTSKNFPVANAFQSAPIPGESCREAFVTKLDPSVPAYVFSTYLGGTFCDTANSVATDPSGNVYLTGTTESDNFPTMNPFQPSRATGLGFTSDAFVTKFTATGSMSYSTYLGGSSNEAGNGIATDASGNAYITGATSSTNFPTANPIQANDGGLANDVFVTKLNSQGSALVYSTYLGGKEIDVGRGIAVDSTGSAYVTGFTESDDFPVRPGAIRTRSAVYKSVDGAANWGNDNYGLTNFFIWSIAVHPTQSSTVYVGTSNGVFKSTNGGRTWSHLTDLSGKKVVAIVIDPSTPSIIYAATDDLSGFNDGVYKSTDGGTSWHLRKNGMHNTNVQSLVIDPVTPATLYASTLGGPIYKTTDGADSWSPTGSGGPVSPRGLAVDPHNHTTIYATEFAPQFGSLYRSTNAGGNWQHIGPPNIDGALFVKVSPHTPGVVYLSTGFGIFKSVNGGDTWSQFHAFSGEIVLDPVNPSILYVISDSVGLQKTADGGQTWTLMNDGLDRSLGFVLAIDPQRPSTLYFGSAPALDFEAFVTKINPAGDAFVYSTFIGGKTPPGFVPAFNAQAFAIAVDPAGNAYITGVAGPGSLTTPTSYQPFNRGFEDAFISKLIMSHIISGRVLESGVTPVSNAEVVLNDGASLTTVTTEDDGSYQFSHLREGGSFTVSATKPHFTITPVSQTFNNLSIDQTLDFTATTTNAPFFTISGQITDNGVGLPGVTVTLSGSQPGLRTTDINGNYSFELAGGGNYTVTPLIVGFTFGPSNLTFNNLSASQIANFTGTRQTFVVTNTNNHGAGSLRDAMITANATPGLDTITFNIPGPGVKVITPLNELPQIIDPVTIDATTQPGYAGTPLIELDGTAIPGANGLAIRVEAGGSTIRGFAIGGFSPGVGIQIRDSNNNVVQGNYIGLDATGTVARPNARGIQMFNTSNNLIGGTTAAARNVISGNIFDGIELSASNSVVQGNFIGTNAAGTAAIENGGNGINISNSINMNNLIGGTTPGAGNLISGNSTGVSGNGSGTVIQGNLIGTDLTGTKKVPNGMGVQADAANILIGGLTASARNVISGNDGRGVQFGGVGSKLQGNFIGTDISGTLALGNGSIGVTVTTNALGGGSALIGGTVPEARNVIAANTVGISLPANSIFNPTNTVHGNYIGTDVTGTHALGNSFSGIDIQGANYVVGGMVAGAGNVISGNLVGMQIGGLFSGSAQNNTVQGNLIGLNAQGTAPLPNKFGGINLAEAIKTTIGGTQAGAANVIAFNGGPGVAAALGSENSIRGNSIFSNFGLGIDLGTSLLSIQSSVTPNDPNDPDTGPNNLQNFPVLTSVSSIGSNTTIQGSLNSTPNQTFQIDFYTSAALDPSGNGEGAQFLGTTSVTTDGSGNTTFNASFPVALGSGRVVTATATDSNGNTSEFSAGDASGAIGNLQFTVDTMHVIEDVGVATITVERKGGSAGTLTVDYATADGTATAGQDYTATSGTLTFLGGEISKTFQIPIADEGVMEPDETFTVTLSNTSSLESLGAPATLVVTIQDRTTVPQLFVPDATVIEGGPGTTTQLLFTVRLTAATGQTVSANFDTSNLNAFGGTTCDTRGVDYEVTSGTVKFQPGTSSVTVPVTVCGDTNAEAREGLLLTLSNAVNATFVQNVAVGVIENDDVLELVLEESGPAAGQAAALDALLLTRDPFRILGTPDWFPNGSDRNTRVVLFGRNLELNPGESPSAVIVRIQGVSNPPFFDIPAEDVRPIHNFEFTQVIIRLPDNLPAGERTVTIRAHGRISNPGTIRIVP